MSIALVCVAVFAGALLQSAAGFGFALVTAPALFAAFEPGTALTVESILSVLLSGSVLAAERRRRDVHRESFLGLIGWSLPGLAVGLVVLAVVAKPALQVAVGLAVVAAVLPGLAGREAGAGGRAWPVPGVGFVTGVLSTTVGINGPPLLIHFQRLAFDPVRTRDTLAACFLALGPLTVLALAVVDRVSLGPVGVPLLVGLLALVAAGRALGRVVFVRLEPEQFRRAGLVLALAAGIASVASGVAAA